MASNKDKGQHGRKKQVSVNENSPVIKAFRGYQTALDTRHDKHERIVKLSRDITIESKRAIFLLQRCAGGDSTETQGIMKQAESKLKEVQQTRFLHVAQELDQEDHYQFIRAYSPGLQEYIEAISFFHYLKDGSLITLSQVEKDLKFPRPSTPLAQPTATADTSATQVSSSSASAKTAETMQKDKNKASDDSAAELTSTSGSNRAEKTSTGGCDMIFVTVPPVEFMLGIADLTGELMRTAIMSVNAGNLDHPVEICKFMRIIHDAFTSYGNTARELTRKMSTLRQSLGKVENACYTLKVRGSEIPKHMLADIFTSMSADGLFVEDMEDSGYD
ncbi:translin-associated protein X-like [Littorina saxatilis]|uniref:Translin-associated protein X n=1 Tax=Littorina saxatilis TaxID=31220 RepID=A0AAN9GDA2_9CAEN